MNFVLRRNQFIWYKAHQVIKLRRMQVAYALNIALYVKVILSLYFINYTR
jgi:hypothetical protein